MRQARPFRVLEYQNESGACPYRNWLDSLGTSVKAKVQARILRTELGNLGDHKAVGGGVWELRLDFGPGDRVFFGFDGNELVILLVGGDKGSQRKDISLAQAYWADYKSGGKHVSKK